MNIIIDLFLIGALLWVCLSVFSLVGSILLYLFIGLGFVISWPFRKLWSKLREA